MQRSKVGVPGLDEVLDGGFIAQQLYLVDGQPGAGKTTFSLQFLLEGVHSGEKCTYITLSETKLELEAGARSHGWSLDGIEIIELIPSEEELRGEEQLTMLPASEVVMFAQVDGASIRAEGGLGVGLALVKGLIDLHGGTVEARSAGLGQGSEFTARLPLPALEQFVVGAPDAVTPPRAITGRRILVADDNKDAADALAMILEMDGHVVRVAHNGRVALSLAQTFRPDVAILDIGMPDMSGYEVARFLRREEWGRGIFIIALTGWGQEGDQQQALDAGFDYHLTKPVDLDVLEKFLSDGRQTALIAT